MPSLIAGTDGQGSAKTFLRSTFVLAALVVACGRTVLDDPVGGTGTAGANAGSAGAGGTAGIIGTAGAVGTAGFLTGTAGFAGAAGSPGTADMPVSGGCGQGETECFSATDVGVCNFGQWIDDDGADLYGRQHLECVDGVRGRVHVGELPDRAMPERRHAMRVWSNAANLRRRRVDDVADQLHVCVRR
jgi:hypothetical protein